MIRPTLEKIELSVEDRLDAIEVLDHSWRLPDGTEVIDRAALATYRKQLQAGYFYRLCWPPGTSRAQAFEWHGHAAEILEWRRLGLL